MIHLVVQRLDPFSNVVWATLVQLSETKANLHLVTLFTVAIDAELHDVPLFLQDRIIRPTAKQVMRLGRAPALTPGTPGPTPGPLLGLVLVKCLPGHSSPAFHFSASSAVKSPPLYFS